MSDIKKDNLDGTEEYVGALYFDEKLKPTPKERMEKFLDSRYFLVACFVSVSIIAFNLGRISGVQEKNEPVRILNYNNKNENPNNDSKNTPNNSNQGASAVTATSNTAGKETVVGSKNGTKYHYPWCSGAKQIAEKNLITFNSIEEARAKGYTPASNCKGLR